MKKPLLLAVALGVASSATVQAGSYEFIPYYNNNPFVFCTVGVPQDCWVPISKELGTFSVTNYYCFNPTSAALFARVCPQAFSGGGSAQRGGGIRLPSSMQRDPANASP